MDARGVFDLAFTGGAAVLVFSFDIAHLLRYKTPGVKMRD